MRTIVEMTICQDCNKFLGIGWGDLNQEYDRIEECEICQKDFNVYPAYDIEIDVKALMIAIIRKIMEKT
ncbi:hypothetical protein LCGC14_1046270 [marine sediment metagenome]|uniref:Uncharacterized protein n=1 Tax=marine sediment metagenome TaxID=412755 RepID=A0A0F9NBY6_9ZZZZ